MSRRARRRYRPTEAARRNSNLDAPPRRAASRSWPDLDFNRPTPFSGSASATQRVDRIRQALTTAYKARVAESLKRAPNRPAKALSFGSWSLPPTVHPEALKTASECARREDRRHVLFAIRGTGKGSHSPRLNFSNRSCK